MIKLLGLPLFQLPYLLGEQLHRYLLNIIKYLYLYLTKLEFQSRQQKLMTDSQALRLSILQQSDNFGTKKRFGLFSHPISTAVGDNGGYGKKLHPRDPNTKKPITQERNFYTSPTRSGQGDKNFFGQLNPLASSEIKDEFIEPGKRMLKQQKQKQQKGQKHEVSFFTGTGNKILSKSSYQYLEQKKPNLDPKRNRDPDGKVKCEPKNFYSNPNSKVESTFFKSYNHMNDPYDRAHKLELDRNKRNKSMEGEAKFKPNSFSPKLLSNNKSVYGEDVQLKKKQEKATKLNIYKHQNLWKSSNKTKEGIYGYFSPFPEYKQSPNPETKRQQPKQKTRDSFKLNNPSVLSTPTSSITLHRSNIRRSLGH